jgi:Flp pilus assembly protein TadG
MRLGAKTANICRSFKKLLKSNAGNVAPIMGVAIIPLFISLGAAIDTVRAAREETAFHAAVDSAVLAIAADERSAMGSLTTAQQATRIAELKAFAQSYIAANYVSSTGAANDITIDLAVTNQAISMTAHHTFPTAIMNIVGIKTVSLSTTSEVKKAMRPVELTLVMDTTGSMATNSKIAGAKTAAKSLLNTLYGGTVTAYPQSEYIRVSLVPFAAAVHLNKSAYDFDLGWIDTTGANPLSHLNFNNPTWNNYTAWGQMKLASGANVQWNGCVEERANGNAALGQDYVQNDEPADPLNPDTLFPAYFSPDVPTAPSGSTYGQSYIGTNGTPNEQTGLIKPDYSKEPGLLLIQKNENKYVNFVMAPQTASSIGPWSGCAYSTVVPMTYNRKTLEAGIDAMQAAGPTLIAEGLNWGWKSISPNEPLTKVEGTASIPAATISPYDDVRWRKIMVLMTDGDNDLGAGSYGFNGTTYSSYGRGREAIALNRFGTTVDADIMTKLDTGMLNVCSKIKAKNIELYVTSFGDGVSATTKSRLESCATKPENYKHNTSSADLQVFFDHIGQDVLNKSIYVSK